MNLIELVYGMDFCHVSLQHDTCREAQPINLINHPINNEFPNEQFQPNLLISYFTMFNFMYSSKCAVH